MHPEFIKLGIKFNKNIIEGQNAKCLALAKAFQKFFKDFKKQKKTKN